MGTHTKNKKSTNNEIISLSMCFPARVSIILYLEIIKNDCNPSIN